jgi:pimeloyl-ACP methyl ester carboxylesterase
MLDRPFVGARTFDVLRILQLLKSAGHDQIHVVAKGWGTLPALFAALLDPDIRKITLKHPLESYSALLKAEDYRWPYATMLPGVISQFDLPDCYAELRARDLTLIAPWGPADGMN